MRSKGPLRFCGAKDLYSCSRCGIPITNAIETDTNSFFIEINIYIGVLLYNRIAVKCDFIVP